jgi:ABC-2 type transport system ATP-binding protein
MSEQDVEAKSDSTICKAHVIHDEDMVVVTHVSMHFNLSSEIVDNVKDYFIKLVQRKLFYQDFIAVDDISFNVKKGEVFGIVGTNGSGKSTMLKMISGVLKPTTGTIDVRGNISPLIELGAGFDPELTARENVYLNGAILGYNKKFLDDHFDQIVEFAELHDFMDVPIKNYSSGMVARIGFAIATVVKPDILIVDEILSVGDFLFQEKCENRINELMDGGTTVIIVSHSIEQIERLCDRALWIEKSKQRMVGSVNEVCEMYRAHAGD